jgi:hypothetical protein
MTPARLRVCVCPRALRRASVATYASPSGAPTCQLSLFGGGAFTVNGLGFTTGLTDAASGRFLAAAFEPTPCSGAVTPSCAAANASQLTLSATAATGYTASFALSRWRPTGSAAGLAGSASALAPLLWRPRVGYTGSTAFDSPISASTLGLCGARTPVITGPTATSTTPSAGGSLTLTWAFAGTGSADGVTAATVGGASSAVVQLQSGSTVVTCSGPTVSAATLGASSYTETLNCTLPAYLPAATYTVWVCYQPFGCGYGSDLTVALSVTGVLPASGSSAGGTTVTITGSGFDTNASFVAVAFGSVPCTVTAATATSLTCVTGALNSKPGSAMPLALSVTPTSGASASSFPSLTFSFDPALEASISSVSPARGSTEGGTAITITGTGFDTLGTTTTTVAIGSVACGSVSVVNAATITCVAGAPPSDNKRLPLAVTVSQSTRGLARGSVTYQYIDLWSRSSTWGGGSLPTAGALVEIPAGLTVLLDVSPPALHTLVLGGNLIFDDTQVTAGSRDSHMHTAVLNLREYVEPQGLSRSPHPHCCRSRT